ncbi:MFS transporter [Neobacillus pocheonensis]|uniref:MFS transporter n=1 Tax=Neobacillus pocheonensis TaxID=363869 RepID=A0ABT0WD74_9BACI|nr:MFS transporter [Neobacillus pocheonensis]
MKWIILLFMFFGIIINYADKSIIGYAAEPIMKEFHLTYTQWGLVGSSFFWLFIFAGVIGGAWSDRIGTKKTLTILLFLWTILQFGVLAISGLPLLILYRVLLGAGEGPHGPVSMSQISRWFPPQSRGFAIAIFNGGAVVGALLFAPLFVKMITNLGWRGAIASLGILSIIWVVLWMLLGKENPATVNWNEPIITQSKVKWSEASPIIFSRTCLLSLFVGFSAFGLLVWVSLFQPLYFGQVLGFTKQQIGLASAGIGIGGLIISILLSRFSDRLFIKNQKYYGSRVLFSGVCLLIAGVCYLTSILSQSNLLTLLAFTISGGCATTVAAMVPQIMMKLFPTRRGFGVSLGTSFQNIAGIVGPIVCGALISLAGTNKVLGFHYALFYTAGLMLIAGLLFILFCRPDKATVEAGQPNDNSVSI